MEPHRREQERAGSGSRSVPASTGLPAISRETEGPDTDIQVHCRDGQRGGCTEYFQESLLSRRGASSGLQAGTVLLDLSQHLTQGNSELRSDCGRVTQAGRGRPLLPRPGLTPLPRPRRPWEQSLGARALLWAAVTATGILVSLKVMSHQKRL